MNALSKVLIFKITFTVLGACVPLLLLPVSVLQALGFVVPEPQIFLRLLGMAYAALIVGYGFGLRDSLRGTYPGSVVWMGIVSNGGAAMLTGIAAAQNTWGAWGLFAQCLMWGSLICLCGITLGLVVYGPFAVASRAASQTQFAQFL